MQITKVDGTSNRFFLKNNGQITIFTSAKLTVDGNIIISRNGEPISLLGERIVEEATHLMIDNGIVITSDSDKVGV
jgi:hypothetical protein